MHFYAGNDLVYFVTEAIPEVSCCFEYFIFSERCTNTLYVNQVVSMHLRDELMSYQ